MGRKFNKYQINKLDFSGNIMPPTRRQSKNKYLVVNVDEPYAEEIFNLIRWAEIKKGTWDRPDDFQGFIDSISSD